MNDRFMRTRMLLGDSAMERLRGARVLIFGIGGVGGFAAEALVRSGVGALDLVDHDCVELTNLNRQIIALESTLGRLKAEVMAERAAQINPDCKVRAIPVFYGKETAHLFDFAEYDYVIDAIDSVTSKLLIIETAKACGVPVISAMGAGNKLDPSALEIADLYETSVCPLARVMRRECRKRGIESLKVVWSREEPMKPEQPDGPAAQEGSRRAVPGSVSFVPSAAGLMLAGEVIRDLTGAQSAERK